jgi:CheY-like chemotaxis protein
VGTERILVVEDTASVRRLAVAAFTRHGYRVVEAESGADALDTLKGSESPSQAFNSPTH